MSTESDAVPVTILTGFLGSGKTTILRGLLAHRDMTGTAVVINELGEIGIDQLLVDSPVLEPVLLPNGCLCCTSRGQLAATLEDLAAHSAFPTIRRVVVETTGLANPIPLLHALAGDQAVMSRYRLGGVVTTVDCVNGAATLARYEEAVCQIAIADRLLITKTDLASTEARRELKRKVAEINSGGEPLDIVAGAIEPQDIGGLSLHDALDAPGGVVRWVGARAEAAHHAHEHVQPIGTFHVIREQPLAWSSFMEWMEMLVSNRGADLLRVKGILNVAEWPDEPVVIHGVQHVFHPPVRLPEWPGTDRRSRIVFITRGLGREAVERTLHLLEQPARERPHDA